MKKILFIIILLPLFSEAQTKLIAPLVRNSSSDTYPTHYDSLQRSGLHVYATYQERNAIPSGLRKVGMVVRVARTGVDSSYTLSGGIANSNWVAYSTTSAGSFVDLTTNQTIGGTKTFSNDAVINGLTIGKGAGAITPNTAFGINALQNTTGAGFGNTGVGYQAMQNTTTGQYNTAIGMQSLQSNSTGSNNTAIGQNALNANSTASYNTAVGNGALRQVNTGSNNTAIGYFALQQVNSGTNNIGIGHFAGAGLSSGSSGNIVIGDAVLSGSQSNVFIAATGDGVTRLNLKNGAISSAANTAQRAYTLPDTAGTLALKAHTVQLSGDQTIGGVKTFSSTSNFSAINVSGGAATSFKKTSGAGGESALLVDTYGPNGSITEVLNLRATNSDLGENNFKQVNLRYATPAPSTGNNQIYVDFQGQSGTIALLSDIATRVPYTGATSNLRMGTRLIKSESGADSTNIAPGAMQLYGSTQTAFHSYAGALFQGSSTQSNFYSAGVRFGSGNYTYLNYEEPTTSSKTVTIPHATGTVALTQQAGDIEITDSAKGIILKSPDGTRWRVTVNNSGALTTTSL